MWKQVSINREMDKQTTNYGTFFALEVQEIFWHMLITSINLEDTVLREIIKSQKYCIIPLIWTTYSSQKNLAESRMVVSKSFEEKEWEIIV
jgi:hypothetical protein